MGRGRATKLECIISGRLVRHKHITFALSFLVSWSGERRVMLNLPPVSDSDSLFLEDVDEETNFVQMAVTTLTKHNLLLIEKLQSAKVCLIREIVRKAIIGP